MDYLQQEPNSKRIHCVACSSYFEAKERNRHVMRDAHIAAVDRMRSRERTGFAPIISETLSWPHAAIPSRSDTHYPSSSTPVNLDDHDGGRSYDMPEHDSAGSAAIVEQPSSSTLEGSSRDAGYDTEGDQRGAEHGAVLSNEIFPILRDGLRDSGSSEENLYRFSSLWTGLSGSSEPVQLNTGSIGAYEYRVVEDSSEALGEDEYAELDRQMLQSDTRHEDGGNTKSTLPLPGSKSYPFPSKAVFLTQALFSSSHVRFSEAQKRAILDWGDAMGAVNVPTMHALDRCEKQIQSLLGMPTEQVPCAQTGSVLYRNGLDHAIAKDFANPIVRQSMIEYSVDRGKALSQVHDADKLLHGSHEHTQPCVKVMGKTFYVGELVRLAGGSYCIPERFFHASPEEHPADSDPRTWEIYALGWEVTLTDMGYVVHDERERVFYETSSFVDTIEDLCAKLPENASPTFAPQSTRYAVHMPHRMRKLAGKRMVYTVPIISFIDDVSANISKQWNKNHVAYASNALLPREMLDKAFNIHFVSSSPTASPTEIANAVKMSLEESSREGVVAYDCKYDEEVLLFPYLLCKAGDNPMLAELSSHGGLRCNRPCRTCDTGGTNAHKRTAQGYADLLKEGNLRSPEETRAEVLRQLNHATRVGGRASIKRAVEATGVHDAASDALGTRLLKLGRDLLGSSSRTNTKKQATVMETLGPGAPGADSASEADIAEDDKGSEASDDSEREVRGRDEGKDRDEGMSESDREEQGADRGGSGGPKGVESTSGDLSREDIEERLARELERKIIDDEINPLLGIVGFDVHRDTPTEILHTILLGVVKYFWGQTMFILKKASNTAELALFRARLHSLCDDGLNLPLHLSADYLCQFSGSLIGKHMKSLAQVMPFLICDLVDDKLLHAWNVIGNLVVLLWHTAIDDKEVYLAELSRTIDDFLNLSAQCSPSILITKPKFHFLVHLPMFIRRFGPAILFSTERYESFNRIFRLTCIFSNRRAPSRDSCRAFASFDNMKHILSGGFWKDDRATDRGGWVHAGPNVAGYLDQHPKIRDLLNIPRRHENGNCAGDMRLLQSEHRSADGSAASKPLPSPIPWSKTVASGVSRSDDIGPLTQPGELFYKGSAVRVNGGDIVRPESTAIIDSASEPHNARLRFVKIVELLSKAVQRHLTSLVTVQYYRFLDVLHPKLDLPCMELTSEKGIVNLDAIRCIVNVQHDCERGGCNSATRDISVPQEYQTMGKTRQVLVHKNHDFVVLNCHSIHNHRLIMHATPSHLLRKPNYAPEREPIILDAIQHMVTATRRKKNKAVDSGEVVVEENSGDPTLEPLFDRIPVRSKKSAQNTAGQKKRKRDTDAELESIAHVIGIETLHELDQRLAGPARGPSALTVPALDEQLEWHRLRGNGTFIPAAKSARGDKSARIELLRKAIEAFKPDPQLAVHP
ncbi:unnamed protein product [Peniophora sp. CBMAI 1063]|nr:unnamed protein product [Peniophora sp. CBMAI 1063]